MSDYPEVVTLNENGAPILVTHGDVKSPPDYTFGSINHFVNCEDPQYEELQSLCLGMASRIAELELNLEAGDIALANEKLFNKQEKTDSNQKNLLKALVLFQAECEILADTFRHGNMASDAIRKIDVTKYLTKATEPEIEDELGELTDKGINYILERTFTKQAQEVLKACIIGSHMDDGSWTDLRISGEIPTHGDIEIEVQHESFSFSSGPCERYVFNCFNGNDGIIAYRIAKESQ